MGREKREEERRGEGGRKEEGRQVKRQVEGKHTMEGSDKSKEEKERKY